MNIEKNKKFTENSQNHKTNKIEIRNFTQQEHDYVIKQNTKANTIWQPVTKTKTLNHENISTKIRENITQNSLNIDTSTHKSKTDEAINETTKKISVSSDLIGNVIGKNGLTIQQIQDTYNKTIYTKF